MSMGKICWGIPGILALFRDSWCQPTLIEVLLPIGFLALLSSVYVIRRRKKLGLVMDFLGFIFILVQVLAPIEQVDRVSVEDRKSNYLEECQRSSQELKEIENTKFNSKNVENLSREFLSQSLSYCRKTFQLNYDEDSSWGELKKEGYNSHCEDGVRCFNLMDCKVYREQLDAASCFKLYKRYYTWVNGNPEKEAENISLMKFSREDKFHSRHTHIGTCDLPNLHKRDESINQTWYSEVHSLAN